MGLGSVSENGVAVFLSIAGGFIWNRKAEKTDPNYATQNYEKADKSTGTRAGARYADLTGKVVGVQFKQHPEYGESINVTFDSDGERYIISVSTNNRYSQDLMKALLNMDLEKELFVKPYDFVGTDKKRAQGISFRQDGEKIDLKVKDAPTKEEGWFKTAGKKDVKRFFEDLNDWFVAEVEERITPKFGPLEPKAPSEDKEEKAPVDKTPEKKVASKPAVKAEEPKVDTASVPAVTPLKMKMKLRTYSAENYEGRELPALEPGQLVQWYNLAMQEEELPWEEIPETPAVDAEVEESDLDSQLDALLEQ